ncbi:MAG: hypothetical protein J7559_08250 [Cohnella sp.]|nr:hypothetical protein [Cohnella sp.]
MALSIDIIKTTKLYGSWVVIADITFDDSYPTGGLTLSPEKLGLRAIEALLPANNGGYMFHFDPSTGKLVAYSGANTAYPILLSHAGGDIKGSANMDSENADAGALPTNGSAVAAATAVTAGAWTHGTLTQPDMGRNVCISITNDSGGALDLYEGVSTFTVTGTWRGAAQTETITFTSTSGNKSVANTKFRYKYGVKPFDTVTDITVDNEPADGLKISAGLGSKIGLPTALKTPAEADVTKITKTAANLSPSGIVNTTNNTVNLGTLADGDDFTIVYKTVDGITGTTFSEVGNGTDLDSVTIRAIAIGI